MSLNSSPKEPFEQGWVWLAPFMSTPHISAKKGDIADRILLPGDPLRAKWIADNYLEKVTQFNAVRNMFGFTGTYKGERVSVMGTGMGLPSISIYATELFNEYDVQVACLLYTSPSPRDVEESRMPSSA